MKPALTDEEFVRLSCATTGDDLKDLAVIEEAERLTRERLMELVCGSCGKGNPNFIGFPMCSECGDDAFPITRAEYLLREEER